MNALEEVLPTVELALARDTLVTEQALAVGALDTLHVPRLVQNFHQIALHDRLMALAADERSHGSNCPKYSQTLRCRFKLGTDHVIMAHVTLALEDAILKFQIFFGCVKMSETDGFAVPHIPAG